ncbi:hypothetical protein EDD92_0063 [Streptomyces sp. TLI_185]|nr:hypothetical protein EDD92_0063 [Streptomyces sp. TLI_185]
MLETFFTFCPARNLEELTLFGWRAIGSRVIVYPEVRFAECYAITYHDVSLNECHLSPRRPVLVIITHRRSARVMPFRCVGFRIICIKNRMRFNVWIFRLVIRRRHLRSSPWGAPSFVAWSLITFL